MKALSALLERVSYYYFLTESYNSIDYIAVNKNDYILKNELLSLLNSIQYARQNYSDPNKYQVFINLKSQIMNFINSNSNLTFFIGENDYGRDFIDMLIAYSDILELETKPIVQ